MRGRNVETRGADARLPNNARVLGSIPRGSNRGNVQVRLENGRGVAQVIEQPSARNSFQTVIRIQDPLGGSDRYRITAYWTGDDRNGDDRNGGYGNGDYGNGRRDDGGYGRGRDDRNNRGARDRDRDRDHDDDSDGDSDSNDRNGRNRRNRRDRDDHARHDREEHGRNGGIDDYGAGRGALRWSGRVDDVVDITIQGRNIDYRTQRGAGTSDVRSRVTGGGLPRQEGGVTIVSGNGRGSVQVVQQPSRNNGYTAVIRITDPRSGAGEYDIEARW